MATYDFTTSSGNSAFRVGCYYYTESTNDRGDKTIKYRHYVTVVKGDFSGTTIVTSWGTSATLNGRTDTAGNLIYYGLGEYKTLTVTAGGSGGSIPSAYAHYSGEPNKKSNLDAISISANSITSYTHTISHYLIGFNGETGTLESPNENHYLLGEDSDSVSIQYGSSININNYIETIPQGFYFARMWDGSKYYNPTDSYTQQSSSSATFHYYYYLKNYNITYNLNDGTNNPENPETYNILYGKSLKAPTRENYTFVHWVDQNNNVVTGINEGCNAEFSSVDDMYNQLASRTIGDLTLTANWVGNEYTITFNGNGGNLKTDILTINYNSNKNSDVSAYIPTKQGYEFLGWYSSPIGGIQVYDSNGMCTNDGTYWSDNVCVYTDDYVLYAQWKALNIAYYKLNNEWVLCRTYVKVIDVWKPAIMKLKTDGDWINKS